MNWLDQVKNACKIIDVVRRYTPCPNRDVFTIKCPFHKEKTGSLSVNGPKNMFYCFGCHIGGDAIKFVEKIENLTFIEASKKIAGWYGVEIKSYQKSSELEILSKLAEYFVTHLKENSDALSYLHSRGLNKETIAKFQIGWIPSEREFMHFCNANNIREDVLEKIGLKKNIRFLLYNRIVFPIHKNNQVIAFGARTLVDRKNEPKYINTGDSIFFKKKSTLYGLGHIKGPLWLVEGYLDVCVASQSGINAFAPLGTACSIEHIDMCWENSDEVVVCFDGDNAGRTASNKIALMTLENIRPGKLLSFIDMPEDEDPASFLLDKSKINSLSKYSLVNKIWNIFNPKDEKVPEKRIQKYHDLLEKANLIKDKDLRYAYVSEWKTKWFERTKVQDDYKKINDPKYAYESILLATVAYNLNLLDDVCEYILSMDLSEEMHKLREFLLLNKIDNTLDENDNCMVLSGVELYSIKKLNSIAPFTKHSNDYEKLQAGWMEVFLLYVDFINRRTK